MTSRRVSDSRIAILAAWRTVALAAAVVASAACRTAAPPPDLPPDVISAGGVAKYEVERFDLRTPAAAAPVARYEPLTKAAFEGTGSAKIGDAGGGSAQAIALARAEARRAALRRLAGDASAFAATREGTPLLEALGADARSRLESAVESLAAIEFAADGDSVRATARLAGDALAGALGVADETVDAAPIPEAAPSSKAEGEGPRRDKAREEALAKAREALTAKLAATRTNSGTIGDLLARDPDAKRRADEMIAALKPSKVEFDDAGLCEVEIEFDRSRVVRILNSR